MEKRKEKQIKNRWNHSEFKEFVLDKYGSNAYLVLEAKEQQQMGSAKEMALALAKEITARKEQQRQYDALLWKHCSMHVTTFAHIS